MRKPVGAVVRLRADTWDGPPPEEGDFLRTDTGRCYLIEEIKVTRGGKANMRCRVLGVDAVSFGEPGVWHWRWSAR